MYLKTVGLIPYMAQIGCFVPAGQAVLGIVDRMFTRIHSLETASVNQSSFCIDLGQIGLMLRHATPRSLLLIDEFGKGTTSIGEWCSSLLIQANLSSYDSMKACVL